MSPLEHSDTKGDTPQPTDTLIGKAPREEEQMNKPYNSDNSDDSDDNSEIDNIV